MMKKLGFLLIAMIVMMVSCKQSDDTVAKMTIASEKRWASAGAAPMEVLLVKENGETEWSYFYSQIEGFDYESGFEYVLEVKKEQKQEPVPADASSVRYILVKEVSKTAKESENMPANIVDKKGKDFEWTAKVLEVQGTDVGRGGAAGKFPVKVVKMEVVAVDSLNTAFKVGETIHAELASGVDVVPELEKVYVFTAKDSHPAHALGVYMLEADFQELVEE